MKKYYAMTGTVLLLLNSGTVWAGMPSIRLTPEVHNNLTGISFALFVILIVVSLLIFICWNLLFRGKDLPKITWFKSLIIALLGGVLFCLILVMIAGSRELLTPGAWKQKGVLYELSEKEVVLSRMPAYDPQTLLPLNDLPESLVAARYAAIVRLRNALVQFQKDHDGKLPESIAKSGFVLDYWTIPASGDLFYVYQPKDNKYIVVTPFNDETPVFGIDPDWRIIEISNPVPLSDETVKRHNAEMGINDPQKAKDLQKTKDLQKAKDNAETVKPAQTADRKKMTESTETGRGVKNEKANH